MLPPEMHDSENRTHSASGAETLVLTANNLVYPEPTSTYYGVIDNRHHHHLHHHHNHHQSYYHNHNNNNINDDHHLLGHHHHHHQQHQINTHPPTTVDHQYHDTTHQQQAPSSTPQSTIESNTVAIITTTTTSVSPATQPSKTATQLSDPQNRNCAELFDRSNCNDLSLFHNQNLNLTNDSITIDNNTTTAAVYHTYSTLQQQPKINDTIVDQPERPNENSDALEEEDDDIENEEDDDDDEDQEADGDEDDEEDESDEDDDDDEVDDEDEGDESEEDDSEGIVDPGQHSSHEQAQTIDRNEIIADPSIRNDNLKNEDDILDGERMLEVTRKLVRLTERDPDRDLRKQVLLKTAIKKLPHFMDYNRYSDTLDRSFHSNTSPQVYYEHHDSQPKFYNSVQPNAIQMSTTSLRMLDLNDDHDSELISINQNQANSNIVYQNNNSNLYIEVSPMRDYEQYPRDHTPFGFHSTPRPQMLLDDLEQQEPTTNVPLLRHNSLDNLYQPINGSDINNDVKDVSNGHERIPLAFQIACEIYDFDCTSDDNEKKMLDTFTEGYYTPKSTKNSRTNNSPDEENDCNGEEEINDTRDPEGSDTSSSSSHSSISTSDESANSLASQSNESDGGVNGTSLTEASLNSSSDLNDSPDSGVALFPTTKKSNNKRSSSSMSLDDEMEIDHLTELTSKNSDFTPNNNQYKKLRKRDIMEQ